MKTATKISILLVVLLIMGTTGTLIRYDQLVPIKANQIINTPAGTISSDNVQGALNELDTEKAPSSTVSNATHTGDATGATALTLATVNSNVGTYNNVTINGKGLATAGSNVAYLTSEVDGSTSNELQTISKVGSTVTLSNGGGSFTDDTGSGMVYPASGVAMSSGTGWNSSFGIDYTLTSGENYKFATSGATYSYLSTNYQTKLVSGTSIATINGSTLLQDANFSLQATLVSGTNIKTVGGTTLLGTGDIALVPNSSVTSAKFSAYGTPSAGKVVAYDATYDLAWITPISGTGTSGRVTYYNGSSSITSDADLTFDGANLTVGGNITGAEVYRGSSRKLKTNIKEYNESATTILKNTKIYSYNLKSNGSKEVGFIAEDTNPILSGENQVAHSMGNHLGVLTKAFQEQDKRISKLTASTEIQTLKLIIWIMGFFMFLLSMSVIYLFKTRLK